MTAKKKISVAQALKALRKMAIPGRRNTDADAIILVRGRLDQEGKWEVDWEAAHWMPDLDPAFIAPSGLPLGLGSAAAQELASVSASDAAEDSLGRVGAALGKGIWDAIGSRVADATNKNGQ